MMADRLRTGIDLHDPAAPGAAAERTVVLFVAVVVGLSLLLFALARLGTDAGGLAFRDGSGLTPAIAGALGGAVAGLAYRGEIYDLVELVLYSLLSIGIVSVIAVAFRDRSPDDPLTRARKRIAGRWRLTLADVAAGGAPGSSPVSWPASWTAALDAGFAPSGDFRASLGEASRPGLGLAAGELGISAHPTAERMRLLFVVEAGAGGAEGRYLVEVVSRRDEDDGRIMFAGRWFRLGEEGTGPGAAGEARLVAA